MKNYIDEKVLNFYKIMPFNIYGDISNACNNIKENPIKKTYPFLNNLIMGSKNILDVGCGGGWLVNNLSYHFKDKNVLGIDYNPEALKFAENVSKHLKNNNKFHEISLFDFDPPKKFDLVISIGVLHHTHDCLKALDKTCKFLNKKSNICIGLYHKYGRKPFLDFVKELNNLDEDKKFEKYKEIHKLKDQLQLKSWFRDQVLHPHETQHTLSEVLDVFKLNNIKFTGTSINHFKLEKLEDILKKEKELYSYGKTKIDNKIYYPGFFIVTGEKNDF